MQNETILNVFPAADDLHRLVIAVQQEEGHAASRLVLRQETYADDVGWFVQSCVAIETRASCWAQNGALKPVGNRSQI